MKLQDYGDQQDRSWFQQLLEWSRKKITFEDNVDCVTISVNIATSETLVDHSLGRVPIGIIPVLKYPNNVTALTWTQAPTNQRVALKAATAGTYTLLIY